MEEIEIQKGGDLVRKVSRVKRFEVVRMYGDIFCVEVYRTYFMCMAKMGITNRAKWMPSPQCASSKKIGIYCLCKSVFDASKGRSGAEKIFCGFKKEELAVEYQNYLKRQGLLPGMAKLIRVKTGYNHAHPIAPNFLRRNFSARMSNKKWVSNIT